MSPCDIGRLYKRCKWAFISACLPFSNAVLFRFPSNLMSSLPSVQGVRVATPDDLHRISTVAAAAFFSSPTFQFQRPFHQAFPSDTIASYFVQYEAAIEDPLCVVLVAEDTLEADEARHVYEALRGAFSSQPPSQQGIVGVCSIQLKPDSCYMDQLHQTHKPDSPAANQHAVDDLRRDQSAEAVAIYNNVTRPAKLKYAGSIRFPQRYPDHQIPGILTATCASILWQ